ncbi:MAG: ABC transporter permease, partial [Bryobacterales bacterium]|nr:ABC transporter permease [Bryobacterales bacterium]
YWREESRHALGWAWLERFIADLRYALRGWRREPGFTVTVLAVLALGIGTTTAMFSLVEAILLRPLPYASDRAMAVFVSFSPQNVDLGWMSMADFLDWRASSQSFERPEAHFRNGMTITSEGEPANVRAAVVTGGFFDALGVKPYLGRVFTPADEKPGNTRTIVLGYRLWRTVFRGDPNVVGRSFRASERDYTVIGVAPPEMRFPEFADLWMNMTIAPPTRRGPFILRGIAKLKESTTIEQARAELATLGARIEKEHPKDYARLRFPVVPLRDWITQEHRPTLRALMGAVGLLFLLALVNVASMMLARASSREQEFAIRTSLGAGSARLARQLITEGMLLSIGGGAAGLALAWILIRSASKVAEGLPRMHEVGMNAAIAAFSLAMAVLAGLLISALPAWSLRLGSIRNRLVVQSRTATAGHSSQRARWILVTAEIAMSCALLASAGLLIRSFFSLRGVDLGFQPDRIVTIPFMTTGQRFSEPARVHAFQRELVERVRLMPQVESAALSTTVPPNRVMFSDSFEIEGAQDSAANPAVPIVIVTPGYFEAMGIRMIAGRGFHSIDKPNSPLVAIIPKELADRYFPGRNPIGRRIKLGGPSLAGNPYREIIGVAGNVRYQGMESAGGEALYVVNTQLTLGSTNLIVRAKPGAADTTLTTQLRAVLSEMGVATPPSLVFPMETLLAESLAPWKLRAWLTTAFAALALLLAGTGVYGVLAYMVAQRRSEFGIRVAIGATPAQVAGLVLKQIAWILFLGLLAGTGGVVALLPWMEPFLYGVKSWDPAALAIAAIWLGLAALLAALAPVWRATRIDPVETLRS